MALSTKRRLPVSLMVSLMLALGACSKTDEEGDTQTQTQPDPEPDPNPDPDPTTGGDAVCGDGKMEGDEACDDGGTVTESCDYGQTSCTVCDDSCQLVAGATSFCGDGATDAGNAEACDDGNTTLEDCAYGEAACTVCDGTCQSVAGATSLCGDGVIDGANAEACDDDNSVVGDGCSDTCVVEDDWACSDEPSVCEELLGQTLSFVGALFDGHSGVDGLSSAYSVTMSPDGKHVYATGTWDGAIAVFEQNEVTGALSFVQVVRDRGPDATGSSAPYGVAVSHDGKNVYMTDGWGGFLVNYSRNETTGELTYLEIFGSGAGDDPLNGAFGVLATPDNKHLYVTSNLSDSVFAYSRDEQGLLTLIGTYANGTGSLQDMDGANFLALSEDGRSLYVTGYLDSSLILFSRNLDTGALSYVEAHVRGQGGDGGLYGARGVVVSPDSLHVYVVGEYADGIGIFERNLGSGSLSFLRVIEDETVHNGSTIDGLNGSWEIAISRDGSLVYVTAKYDHCLNVFSRNPTSGDLTLVQKIVDGEGGVTGMDGPYGLVVSPDDRYVHVAAYMDNAVLTFSR